VTFEAVRRIYDYARYERDAPLLLCVSFTHPHDPYVARQRYWDFYADDEIDLPVAPALPEDELDPHSRRLWHDCEVGVSGITEDDVRSSRHGFYASLSYIDERIGEVLEALERCHLADDTVVVFTSDHGDFLGEHGLFYKMSFREHSVRVPLVVHAPERFAARRMRQPVSLVDVMPTLVDLARAGRSGELSWPVDGTSLLPLLEGASESPDATVAGEYLAESALAPMVMLRRGRWKFIHTVSDPDQLFDLEADPLELVNVAGDHEDVVAAFLTEVRRRWDLDAVDRAVRESQQARLMVFRALQAGDVFPWDFQPLRPASQQYTRNTMDVAARDRLSRFPPAR
jgi:choline-sulfatase